MAQVKVTYNGKSVTYNVEHTFATQGKLMASDFVVEPIGDSGDVDALRTVTPTESLQHVTPSEGKIGLAQVDVMGITPTYVGSEVPKNTASSVTSSDWSHSAAGDSVTVTVTIPAGYYENPTTLTYTAEDVLPPIDPDASAEYILLGYKAYDETGATITGTMPNNGDSSLVVSNNAGTLTIPAGYYNGEGQVTATPGSVQSGSITYTAFGYQTALDKFVSKVDADAPTAVSAGWISSTTGTKSGSTENIELDVIGVGLDVSSDSITVKPTISKQAVSGAIDASTGSATSTVAAGKPYVAVKSNAVAATATIAPTVTSEGYGTAAHFDAGASAEIHAGAQDSDITYVEVKEGSIAASGNVSGNITLNAPSWNGTNYSYSASDAISGSAIATGVAGWINDGAVTQAISGSASESGTLNKLAITVSAEDKALTPSISREAFTITDVTDAASGAAVTTAPTTGVYVKIKSGAASAVAAATASAGTGYSDGQTGHYDVNTASANFTLNASADTYVPITTQALATPTISHINAINASATALTIGTVADNAVVRFTATETQAAGWTSGTESSTYDIPVFVGEFA